MNVQPEVAQEKSSLNTSISTSPLGGDVVFWLKWIGTVILAVVLSWGFYEYNKSVSGNGTALPVVLFTVVAALSSVIQWAAFRDGLQRWVVGNLAAGLALGLLHNLLYQISEAWWDLHLGILLTIWVTGNFVFGAILIGNAQGRSKSVPLSSLEQSAAERREARSQPTLFFIWLSVSLLLFFLQVFTTAFGLNGADLFTILLGATSILLGILFFLTRDIPRNFGYIALVAALFLNGVMLEINLFTSDFAASYFTLPALLALASGIFFATQRESRQDFRFLLLAGFLITLGIAQIAGDNMFPVYDVLSKVAAIFALAAAFSFFRRT
jgi:hypothetical protein